MNMRTTRAGTPKLPDVVTMAVPRITIIAITLAVAFAAPIDISAQDTTGVGAMVGVVRADVGGPAAGVRVCALDTPQCVTTDPAGAFRISDLRSGPYKLEILPATGLPFTTDVIEVRAGVEVRVDVTLPPAAS